MDASGTAITAAAGREGASRRPGLAALAWSVGALSVAALAAAWVLAARNRDLFDITAVFGPDRFLVAYPVSGVILASRRPSNPVGWLLLGVGLMVAARGLAGEYALYALRGPSHPAAGVWAAWFVDWSLGVLFPAGALTFLLLLFPDGQLLTARWRAVGWLAAGLVILSTLGTWFTPGPVILGPGIPVVTNPTGIGAWIHHKQIGLVGNAAWLSGFVCLLLAVASLVVRYRRSAAEERLQLKWFAFAAAVSLSLLVALAPVASTSWGGLAFDLGVVAGIGLALPLALGIAVLRYRLYAIDRIISRTVSYALVTGVVVGVYLGCIALLTRVLPFRGSVGVAAAVLAAAALFNPLRRRVQAVVDRQFDRARYDAERVVAQFSVQLRDEVDLDVLGTDLLGVVHQVLTPAHLTLWLSDAPAGDPAPVARHRG